MFGVDNPLLTSKSYEVIMRVYLNWYTLLFIGVIMKKQKAIKNIVKHLKNFVDIKLTNTYSGYDVVIKTRESEIFIILRKNLWDDKGCLQLGSSRFKLSATEYFLLCTLINSKLGVNL